MNYELAKKLKDAGFEQKDGFSFGIHLNPFSGKEESIEKCDSKNTTIDYDSWVYIPTLEELIEACGEDFDSLDYYPKNKTEHKWVAFSSIDEKTCEKCGSPLGNYKQAPGKNSSEAVAKLWLKLNKK